MSSGPSFFGQDAAYYNRFTDGYSPYADSDLDVMLKPLDDIVRRFDRPRICEVGCASGQFSQSLANRYASKHAAIYGLDIAAGVLAVFPYHRICGSAFVMPVKDQAIDIVCLPAALHHLFPLEDSLGEIIRVIRTGGFLYCLEPNFHHPQRFFFMQFKAIYNLYRNTNDIPINAGRLKGLLGQFGMTAVSLEYVNLRFAAPSALQRLQNRLAGVVTSAAMKKYALPWFILVAQKA